MAQFSLVLSSDFTFLTMNMVLGYFDFRFFKSRVRLCSFHSLSHCFEILKLLTWGGGGGGGGWNVVHGEHIVVRGVIVDRVWASAFTNQ